MTGSGTSQWSIRVLTMLLLAVALQVSAQPAQAPRIGYVDMKRLLDRAPQMTDARRMLETEFAARDASLQADEKQLAERRAAFEREAVALPAGQADARKREIDALERSLRRSRDNLRNELKARSDQVLDTRWREINNVVVEFARESGYDLIVQSPVIYASSRVDVTDAVLDRLGRQNQNRARP